MTICVCRKLTAAVRLILMIAFGITCGLSGLFLMMPFLPEKLGIEMNGGLLVVLYAAAAFWMIGVIRSESRG